MVAASWGITAGHPGYISHVSFIECILYYQLYVCSFVSAAYRPSSWYQHGAYKTSVPPLSGTNALWIIVAISYYMQDNVAIAFASWNKFNLVVKKYVL